MKALIATIVTIAGFAPVAAFAASSNNVDNSGIFVWIFLGFCALIVLAQVIPAILLMFGMVKGVGQVVTEKKTVTES
jgi:hypothetical protein